MWSMYEFQSMSQLQYWRLRHGEVKYYAPKASSGELCSYAHEAALVIIVIPDVQL